MKLYYNSRNTLYKKPFGAAETDQSISIVFPIESEEQVLGVSMFVRSDEYNNKFLMQSSYDAKAKKYKFYCDFSLNQEGVYFYRFEIYTKDATLFVGKNIDGRAILGEWLPEWQLTVFHKSFQTPDWIKGGLIYHIFPDRFARISDEIKLERGIQRSWYQELSITDADGKYYANDFYGGNIKGVLSKLDYLEKLGVTAIYFSPIFASASNHRYDTGDYFKIDPLFGTEAEFRKLIKEAKKCGISIILDGVFNHTGADSEYFNKFGNYNSVGAYQSNYSKYYDWYTFYHYPDSYDCWWGVTICPTIARDAKGFQEMIAGPGGVIEKWTSMGVRGWRLDVVDEISDDFVVQIRNTCKKFGDVIVIGEVWEDASTKVSYGEKRKYLYGHELDGVMNYPFKKAIIKLILGGSLQEFINEIYLIAENYPKRALDCCMTLLGTHDTNRIINVLSEVVPPETKNERLRYRLKEEDYKKGRARLYLASLIQYFLPGVATVYYGDEVGIQGFEDPINRRPFPQNGGDPILVEHYIKLGQIRKQYKKEFSGDFSITIKDGLLVIGRENIKAYINLTKNKVYIKEQKDIYSGKPKKSISSNDFAVFYED